MNCTSPSPTSSVFIPQTWPMKVFYVMSAVSLPLYIMVLASLLRLRCASKTYNTTFYTILVQHCIIDLITMIYSVANNSLRVFPAVRQFYFNYQQYYIAAGRYNFVYLFLYIRCTGIVFLSLQRYLNITSPNSIITRKVQNLSKLQIVFAYWLVPALISIVALKDTNIRFDSAETLSIVVDQEIIQRNSLMSLIVASITCILCFSVYVALFHFIRKHTAKLSRSLRRELHLAFQVFVLLLALFVVLIYYAFQNYFSRTRNNTLIVYMRSWYPLANGLLSYINPFCVLFLNRDLSTHVIRTATCNMCKSESPIFLFHSQVKKNSSHSRNLNALESLK